jgi:uncharacterized membrane protein YcaP (DUF421 family)
LDNTVFFTILAHTAVVLAVIITWTRVHGLRSFSKMSGFDFAITVSIGSVLASAVTTPDTSVWIAIFGVSALFIIQIIVAKLRAHGLAAGHLDNAPILIIKNGTVLEDNLKQAGMTKSDLWAKLREANAFDLSKVHYVIAESTGDVSVLHGPDVHVDDCLLEGVRRT